MVSVRSRYLCFRIKRYFHTEKGEISLCILDSITCYTGMPLPGELVIDGLGTTAQTFNGY